MISLHFVKPETIPVDVVRYLSNLRGRMKTAEYSRNAGWEFNKEEVDTYFEWASMSAQHFFRLLREMASDAVADVDRLVEMLEFFQQQKARILLFLCGHIALGR